MEGPARPVAFDCLTSWAQHPDTSIRYYSGTAVYTKTFQWEYADTEGSAMLFLDSVYNMATVKVNGVDCGTIWTAPYQVNIARALRKGTNELRIEVTNTWANRLIGDQRLPAEQRITWTNAPFRLQHKPLLPAGMTGAVHIIR